MADESDAAKNHWLWRLSSAVWLAAADVELEAAARAMSSRRKMIAHLRRGAGMALNGVLVAMVQTRRWTENEAETRWGRSYVDHLRALVQGDADACMPLPISVQRLASELIELPMQASALVRLQRHRDADLEHALASARELVETCRNVVAKAATDARSSDG